MSCKYNQNTVQYWKSHHDLAEWYDMKCSLYSDFNNSNNLHAFAAFHWLHGIASLFSNLWLFTLRARFPTCFASISWINGTLRIIKLIYRFVFRSLYSELFAAFFQSVKNTVKIHRLRIRTTLDTNCYGFQFQLISHLSFRLKCYFGQWHRPWIGLYRFKFRAFSTKMLWKFAKLHRFESVWTCWTFHLIDFNEAQPQNSLAEIEFVDGRRNSTEFRWRTQY